MPNDLQHEVTSLELVLTDYVGSAYSPQVEVEDIEGGHNVSITHKGPDGIVTDSFDVMDGVSPTVNITSTTQRHTITITDAQGPHVYEVDTYANDELARVTAENGRASAESARVSAESARVDAETGRSTAESARVEAESARSAEEATRAENEGTRVTNETARANAEIARDEAEQAREQAETSREATWVTLSGQATTATQAANNAAQTASQAASDANDAAQAASQTGVSVALAEQGRVQAEQARVTAEQGRATAEQGRVSAESARATEWAEIESDAQSAINAAESATSDATAAAAEARAASAATWLSGNVLFGELAESTVLTADDTYAAPPKGVEVFGKSTQDGTPTPDAPVPIKSVDDLTLNIIGKNLLDNDGYFPTEKTIAPDAYYFEFNSVRSLMPTIQLVENVTYTCSMNVSSSAQPFNLSIGAGSGSYLRDIATASNLSNGHVSVTFTPTQTDLSRGNIFAIRVPRRNTPFADECTFTISDVQLEVSASATAYAPYVGASVSIPLSNHIARSLPDGTRDELTLSYVGPSTEHEGWGVYSETLTEKVASMTFDGTDMTNWSVVNTSVTYPFYSFDAGSITGAAGLDYTALSNTNSLCTAGKMYVIGGGSNNIGYGNTNRDVRFRYQDMTGKTASLTDLAAYFAEHPTTFIVPMQITQTHDLGTVELPVNPAPDLTAWADGGSAQPTLALTYEQDINIVISELRNAIADMVTS